MGRQTELSWEWGAERILLQLALDDRLVLEVRQVSWQLSGGPRMSLS